MKRKESSLTRAVGLKVPTDRRCSYTPAPVDARAHQNLTDRSSYSSASTSKTSFVTGLWITESVVFTSAILTRPRSSGKTLATRPSRHMFLGRSFSTTTTISPTIRFRFGLVHFCLVCRVWRYSRLHLVQNSDARCCTCRHLRLE